jgi:hypothetical protein
MLSIALQYLAQGARGGERLRSLPLVCTGKTNKQPLFVPDLRGKKAVPGNSLFISGVEDTWKQGGHKEISSILADQ